LALISRTSTRFFALPATLIVAILAIPIFAAAAPHGNFRPFLAQDKYRIFEVRDVAESADGAIWAATWGNGVHRIQGTDWQTYSESNTAVSDWVRSLSAGQGDSMWCASGSGLFLFEDGEATLVAPWEDFGLGEVEIRLVMAFDDGRVVASATEGYVFLMTPSEPGATDGEWAHIATSETFQGGRALSIIEGPDGEVWVGSRDTGIYRYDGTAWHLEFGEGKGWKLRRTDGPDGGTIWAAEEAGTNIFRLVEGVWELVCTSEDRLASFLPFSDGHIYAGTNNGLHVFFQGDWEQLDLPAEIGSPNVESMVFSQRGTFWVGTRQGLVRGARKTWQGDTRTVDNVLLDRLVRGTRYGQDLLAVDRQWRLCRLEAGRWEPVTPLDGRGRIQKSAWTFPGEDSLWLDQDGILRRYSMADGTLEGEWPIPRGGPPHNLVMTSNGDLFLLHTTGAYVLKKSTWVPIPDVEGYERKDVFDLVELAPGRYLATVEEGAEVWTSDRIEPLTLPKNDDVVAAIIDSEGAVWMGSYGSGLMRVESDLSVDASLSQDIYNQLVAKVFEDSRGALWVAFRRGGVAAYQEGRWNNYLYAHGLPNLDTDNIQEDPEGIIWLSTERGEVYRFQPDTDEPETRIETGASTVASHGIASFTFSGWDAWNHTPSTLLTYSWRILTLPANDMVIPWSAYSEETIALTSALPPGDYRLEVRAADENRNVDPTPVRHDFRVQLPFWRTPGFVVPLTVVAVIALLALAVAQRAQQRRKRAEQEIAHMRRYLQNVINSMPSTLIGVDQHGRITHWNQEAERVTDTPPSDAEGRFFDQAYPFLEPIADKIRKAVNESAPFISERLQRDTDDGETAYYDVIVYPLIEDDVTGAVIRVDEVTARVAIEEMMVQTEKMMSVGGLAAGMAHEINNPLGGILQACQNIERRTSPKLRKNQSVAEELGLDMELLQKYMDERGILEFIQGIRSDGARAANIVSDMLAFSRQSESHFAPINVVEMIETVLRLAANDYDLKKHYDFRRVTVTQDHADEGLQIRCDKTKIEQVLLNLVKNATQAMGMAENQAPPVITIETGKDAGYARIEVADNGPGMEENTRKRVFEPFFTTKEVGVGTGLGLSVSFFIVTQQHKGTMSVESAPGQGTRFIICIPLDPDKSSR
jgi:PAS domain S-box-containing protein